jgi:DNA-binding HxlR family transcriptional regulator
MAASAPSPKSSLVAAVCPRFHRAVELIGRRWTGAILSAMLSGATRFTDIVNAVPGLSDRLLSERLKELEAEGIVQRVTQPDAPGRIQYLLTDKGRDLSAVIDEVSCWANRWLEPVPCREGDHRAAQDEVPRS